MICSTFSEFVENDTPAAHLMASFAQTYNIDSVPVGRYELGNDAYVSVQEYETQDNPRFEAHKKWIDIQMLASGSERILTAPIDAGISETPYDDEKDICIYRCDERIETVDLLPDQLVVLFPEDLHAPGNCISCATPVRKLVFKIPVKLWHRNNS